MNKPTLLLWIPALLTTLCLGANHNPGHDHLLQAVSLTRMADTLRALIAAHQSIYLNVFPTPTTLPPEEPDPRNPPTPPDLHRHEVASLIPSHAHILRLTAEHIAGAGAEFSFVQRSLWPIDRRNAPQTLFEQRALETLRANPHQSVYADETLGGRRYFTAAYAENARSTACVDCHNAHPSNLRRDFIQGDFMGALIIRIPLEF
jgi:hypothetical protein